MRKQIKLFCLLAWCATLPALAQWSANPIWQAKNKPTNVWGNMTIATLQADDWLYLLRTNENGKVIQYAIKASDFMIGGTNFIIGTNFPVVRSSHIIMADDNETNGIFSNLGNRILSNGGDLYAVQGSYLGNLLMNGSGTRFWPNGNYFARTDHQIYAGNGSVLFTSNGVPQFSIPTTSLPAGVVTNFTDAKTLQTNVFNLYDTNVYYVATAGESGYTAPFRWDSSQGCLTNGTKIIGRFVSDPESAGAGNPPLSSLDFGTSDYFYYGNLQQALTNGTPDSGWGTDLGAAPVLSGSAATNGFVTNVVITSRTLAAKESNTVLTAYSFLAQRPTTVTVSPFAKGQSNTVSGYLVTLPNDGADFGPDTPGTQTSGIQEAVKAVLVQLSGYQGVVFLRNGEFKIDGQLNLGRSYVIGSGNEFQYGTKLNIRYNGSPAILLPNGKLENCWVTSSSTNASQVYILIGQGGVYGFGNAVVSRCHFSQYAYSGWQNLGVSEAKGIAIQSQYYGTDAIEYCNFATLACGIKVASDHLSVIGNNFQYNTTLTNAFASTNPLACQPAILIDAGINNNQEYTFLRNTFVNCKTCYAVGPSSYNKNYYSRDDAFESDPSIFVAPDGYYQVFNNPSGYFYSSTNYPGKVVITNNYTTLAITNNAEVANIERVRPERIAPFYATTIGVSGSTNTTPFTYLVTLTAGTSLALSDRFGTNQPAPILNTPFVFRPNWKLSGSSVSGAGYRLP